MKEGACAPSACDGSGAGPGGEGLGVCVSSCACPAVHVHTCQAVHECVWVHALGLLEGVGVRGCCDRSGRAGKGHPRWGAQHRSSSSPGVVSR